MAANEIVEKEEGHVVEFDASIFEEDAMQEKLGQDDLALPFLKVLSRQDPTLDDLPDATTGQTAVAACRARTSAAFWSGGRAVKGPGRL